MNYYNVLKAANYIERLEKGGLLAIKDNEIFKFHMGSYSEVNSKGCGTRGCIAGAICHMNGISMELPGYIISEYAADYLGLEPSQKQELFAPLRFIWTNWCTVQPHEAAKVLRHYANTGDVDWSIIKRDSFIDRLEKTFSTLIRKIAVSTGLMLF